MRAATPTVLLLAATACDAPAAAPRDAGTPPGDAPGDVVDAAPAVVCARRRSPPAAVTRCNGDPRLCDRRYDQVAYGTTHNAMASAEDGFTNPNQRTGLLRQLRDGVRGLMLDVHPFRDEVYLCHGVCLLGRRPLGQGLCDVARYLDEDPEAVVTIIFESYVPASDVARAFASAGLLEDVHAQPEGAPWPTLREMITRGRRLVVLTDRDGGAFPWYLPVWRHAQETPFTARTPEELSCRENRGRPENPLFILNHFLTDPFGSEALAERVNHNPLLLERARACEASRGRRANFITVDFHDVGSLSAAVAALNDREPSP